MKKTAFEAIAFGNIILPIINKYLLNMQSAKIVVIDKDRVK